MRLESRLLMHAGGDDHDEYPGGLDSAGTTPVVDIASPAVGAAMATATAGAGARALSALGGSIPALNSLAGAAASLYLNFLGDYVSQWGAYSNITIPVFDQDGDPTAFGDGELATITQVWKVVAEDYAPFQINVTTVPPSSFADGVALKVDIGGDGAWVGGSYSGYSYIGSFTNSIPNVAFVFPQRLGNDPKYTGDIASHESGHAFGLQHQSEYSGTTRVAEYFGGPGDGTAPIMGYPFYARSLWWYGTTTSSTTYQDDMAVLAGSTNQFGYRADDHGNTAAAATPLAVSGTQVGGSGIIGTTADLDAFSFTTDAGTVSLSVAVPAGVNNLAPRLELRDAGGTTVIAAAGADATFGATITATLAAGSYRLVVASNGGYGNVGQYTVGGSIVPPANAINAPTALVATSVSTGQVDLNWADNATSETGYSVERSTAGATWRVLTSGLPADSTSFADTSAVAGTTYLYRVRAFHATATSDYSSPASATTVTMAPDDLTATAVASNRIDLSWGDVAGETGYRIERSPDGVAWGVVGTTGAGVTSYRDTGVAAGTTYHYRVQAINAGGGSVYSNPAGTTTPATPAIPAAPTNLMAIATSATRVVLSWNDTAGNEAGFRIERSSNGGKSWTLIAQVGPNVTSSADTSVNRRKTYSYRVAAFNDAGTSAYSAVATVATPNASGKDGADVGEAAPALDAVAPVTFPGTGQPPDGPGPATSPDGVSVAVVFDLALAEWPHRDRVTRMPLKRKPWSLE